MSIETKPSNAAPDFLQTVVAAMDMLTVPNKNFNGTNLAGTAGLHPWELTRSQIEKVVLYAAGFRAGPEFATADTFVVKDEGIKSPHTDNSLTPYINQHLANNKKVGIRISQNAHKKGANASAPFIFADSHNDIQIIRDDDGNIIGIQPLPPGENNLTMATRKTAKIKPPTTEPEYFVPGDVIQVFPSPKSMKRRLSGIQLENKTVTRKINIGGGFDCRLSNFHASTGKITFTFNFIFDDKNPRNIGDPQYPSCQIEIEANLNEGKIVPTSSNGLSASEISQLRDAPDICARIAIHLIESNSAPMHNLFSTLLLLSPRLSFHTIDGFFSIYKDDQGEIKLAIDPFDVETEDNGEKWLGESPIMRIAPPSPDSPLFTLFKRLNPRFSFYPHWIRK